MRKPAARARHRPNRVWFACLTHLPPPPYAVRVTKTLDSGTVAPVFDMKYILLRVASLALASLAITTPLGRAQTCSNPPCNSPDIPCSATPLAATAYLGCGSVNITQTGKADGCRLPGGPPCQTEYACMACFTASYNCTNCPAPCAWSYHLGHTDGGPPDTGSGTGWSGSANFVLFANCGSTAEATLAADGSSGRLTLVCGGC